MNYIQDCAVNRVITQQNPNDWIGLRKIPTSTDKKKVHRRYPQAMKKRGRHGLGRSQPKKGRKLSLTKKVEEVKFQPYPPLVKKEAPPMAPAPVPRRPHIVLEAWGNLNVNERLMYHQYPKTVRDLLALPNIHQKSDCPPGTYIEVWNITEIKGLLLDSGRLGDTVEDIMQFLAPFESLAVSKVEEYLNTHTKKEVYDAYYFKAYSFVVNPVYRTLDGFYNWMVEEMN